MTALHQAEEQVDMALEAVRQAQEHLSLTDAKEAAIGGALSVIEVALNTVSQVVENTLVERQPGE